jgi:hypothetical protein
VTIHSALDEIKDRSVRFTHEMRKADANEIAATTTLTGVYLDTVARRACALISSQGGRGWTSTSIVAIGRRWTRSKASSPAA